MTKRKERKKWGSKDKTPQSSSQQREEKKEEKKKQEREHCGLCPGGRCFP